MKKVWFQIHWAIGISAGIVLAVVGITGATLSFQNEILRGLNPGVMTVEQNARSLLPPGALLARIQAAHPKKRVTSLTVFSGRERAARVTFAAKPGSETGLGSRRSEVQYADPHTGELLGEARGSGFFRVVMQIHRWLAAGEIGKHIVGASTIALVVMCLSGLYLRWPRRALDWRAWLTFDGSRKGRGFLRELHVTVGTWVLIPYLLMALTGLYWSYGWYRDALFALTGAPRPIAQAAAQRGKKPREGAAREVTPQRQQLDLGPSWSAFERTAGVYTSATLRLPEQPRQPLQVTYLHADSAHERAFNRMLLDPQSGTVLRHERYADKTPAAKLMSSVFVLHSGSFFGVSGMIALMLASVLMPLFAITGWMLYLDRRARKKRASTARGTDASPVAVTRSGTG